MELALQVGDLFLGAFCPLSGVGCDERVYERVRVRCLGQFEGCPPILVETGFEGDRFEAWVCPVHDDILDVHQVDEVLEFRLHMAVVVFVAGAVLVNEETFVGQGQDGFALGGGVVGLCGAGAVGAFFREVEAAHEFVMEWG